MTRRGFVQAAREIAADLIAVGRQALRYRADQGVGAQLGPEEPLGPVMLLAPGHKVTPCRRHPDESPAPAGWDDLENLR